LKKNIQLLFLTILFSNDPPIAKQIPHQIQIHNQTLIDNYYWMNQKGDDWVLNYLNEENQYRDKVLANTTQLHKELYNEMINRLPDYENSVPYIHNNYEYRKIFLKGNDYEIYQRRLVTKKNREWNDILDINELAREFEYADVGWIQPSPNNQYLAFGIDTQGNYRYFIKILNLVTGELLKENIPNTWGKCVWHPDNNRIFYSEKDYTNRNLCIKQHWIGFNNLDDEELIFEEIDTQYSVYLSQSKSGRYMFIGSESTNATDFSFIDLQDKNLKINNISNRKKYHLYYPIQYEKSFYILTNSKNHTENKIVSTLISNPGVQYWKNLFIPEEGHTFENFTIINDHIIIKARHNVNPYFQITNLKNDSTFTIKFKEKLFYLGFKDNYDKDAKHFRFEYSSPTTPQIIYDYDLENYELISKYKRQLNNNFSSNNYNIERHSVMDKSNSAQIPITLIYHKDFYPNTGDNPVLLYGYGAYGSITDSYFTNSYISLMDRGVVIAIAHIRGSADLGKQWYNDGKMLQKLNTFTDFIDCANYLLKNKITTSDRLFAQGISAGGLLMGVVANMAPQLFKGMLIEVPFLDVITTMSDANIPLTTQEYNEWGNPEIRNYFDYMIQYSPYENITEQDYPSMFITASYNDSQVGYWEPAKYVAKLRQFKTDDNLLILSTDMTGSHSGPSGRYSGYKLIALEYAFLLDQAGFTYQGSH
tara:strand:+ start:3402 stop:5513 length:2112 start_codon:yes stop_codon:yes gene_type:complete